jgi:oxygen-dependent protoporphyrinogen oxidase
MPHVIVIGAGISGAAAAWFLRRAGADVTVLDGAERVGGKLHTVELDGIPVDTGAEAMLNRRPEAVALAREVGLTERLTYPATTSANLWIGNALRPIPAGTIMGIPGDLAALKASDVLSEEGFARVEAERPGSLEEDVAVGPFVAERLGRELVDRVVEPLLGGVYAGHADRLSLQATVPQIFALARKEPSLLHAVAQAKQAAPASDQPVFAGLDGGVGQLVPAVLAASGAAVRLRTFVRELHRAENGWRLVVGSRHEPAELHADAVVLACPATPASRLLRDVAPHAAAELGRIEYASMATIAMLYRRADFPTSIEGSGFLVPPAEWRTIKAATFSSAKWGWLSDCSADTVVVRTSVGRLGEEADLQRTNEDLAAVAAADLREAIGIGAPVAWHVARWGGGLPQYGVGHKAMVERIRADVAQRPGLALAGAAYEGVGIPACIATARAAADQVLAHETQPERMAT